MATTTVTGPDGKDYEVTHPDGASEADILAYAKQNYGGQAETGPTAREQAAARQIPGLTSPHMTTPPDLSVALPELLMGVGGAASMGLRTLGRAIPPLARTAVGAGAGATGAGMRGEDVGKGAATGGVVTGAIETSLPVVSKGLRSLPWMKGLIARWDAKRIGNTIGEIAPEMAGRTTATELQNLGRVYTQDLPGGGGKQALRGLFQDLEAQIGSRPVNIPSMGSDPVTVSDAMKEIARLGPRGYGGQNANLMTRIATGMDARALREQILDELRNEIASMRPLVPPPAVPNRGLALPPASGAGVAGPTGRFTAAPQNPPAPGAPSGVRERVAYGPEQYQTPRTGQELVTGPHDVPLQSPREVRSVSSPTQQTRRSNAMPTQGEVSSSRAASLPPEAPLPQPGVSAQPGARRVAIIDAKTGNVIGYTTEGTSGVIGDIERRIPTTTPTVQAPTGPSYLEQYDSARAAYRKGEALLKMLSPGRAYREFPNAATQLHTPELQRYISENRGPLLQRLGPENFAKLVDSVTRGGGLGSRDVLASGSGGPLDALLQVYGRGQGGAPQIIGSVVRTAFPNIGSQYAGRAPLSAPDQLKILLDVLGISTAAGVAP